MSERDPVATIEQMAATFEQAPIGKPDPTWTREQLEEALLKALLLYRATGMLLKSAAKQLRIGRGEKGCLDGGELHCPCFRPGHPCCDCGALAPVPS